MHRFGATGGALSKSTQRAVRPAIRFTPAELTGATRDHVVRCEGLPAVLHRAVVGPFLAMRRAAARAGVDLMPASTFRDFDTQVRIWNEKWTGVRPLLARDGTRLDAARLKPAARVDAILAWSAAPGASRHHWGTELDVYDPAATGAAYRPQLTPQEYAEDGPYARLTVWLDAHMARYGFYRPYRYDRGGVQPEPWHLSHWPTAREASRRLRLATLRNAIDAAPVQGKAALLARLPRIYARYVRNVESPPRLSGAARGP